MRFRSLRVIVVGVLVAMSLTSPVAADPGETYVTEWNRHASNAIFNAATGSPAGAGNPPYLGAIHLAMVQGAVYDAVNDIVGGYQPYRDPAGSPPADASQDAAVVTAAYEVLASPTSTLRMPAATKAWLASERDASMADIAAATTAERFNAGVAAGQKAAEAMLAARATDGRFPAAAFFHPEGEGAGEWRPTTPGVRDQVAWVGNVTPFMLNSPSQLRTEGPQPLTSAAYAAEYNEVKALGAVGASRTPEQNAIAAFFQPQPVEMLNRNFRRIAEEHGLSVADETRLFAMMNLAAADSLISCWNDKSFWRFWRPVTAIHNGGSDGNADTAGDTTWAPLIANPPYPEHPSGYNCGASAIMYAARSFFGTNKFEFDIERTAGSGLVRHYSRFTDVIKDTIDARVYQGIHFRSADVQAAIIGKHVAHLLDKRFLQPVD